MSSSIFRILLVGLLPIAAAFAVEWMPADRPLPSMPPVKPREELRIETPAGRFRPAEMQWSKSLDGRWKFSGLTSSATPFTAPCATELEFVQSGFDDSNWEDIRVPLNWYRVPKYSYGKVLKTGGSIDPASAGGSDGKQVVNSYFKGCYRRIFELPTPLPAGRLELQFDGIGYEAEVYVNGRHAGHHQGDFVPSRFDVTELAKPGENLVALRVLSDFRPQNGKFTRTYGAMWDSTCFKGGIWLPVRIVARPAPRIDRMLLTPDMKGNLRLDYTVENTGKDPVTVTPGITVANARDFAECTQREFPAVTLVPGTNRGTLELACPDPKLWSPETPELYYATLHFRTGDKVLCAEIARFGFREFRIDGTKFTLNGKPVYLCFESAHSVRFGGYDTPDGNSVPPRTVIEGHLKKGYNMLRTAHMPVRQEVLDLADELGMMIYDEWSCSFITGMDEKKFEANNLPELERFLLADYNHPSVVMWSLGNEVSHRRDPAIARQLAKQSKLARRIDLQKRPICAFSGNGNVDSYGRADIDTDVIDLHLYTGINRVWTEWNSVFDLYYKWCAEVFGDGKRLEKPVIISECIGGGWGMKFDSSFKLGDIDRYLDLIRRPNTWGHPGAAGYSGSIGVAAATDPKRGYRYLQNRLGIRIAELIRLDSRIAGFAPWLAIYNMENAPLWNQPVYPGLRYPGHGRFLPRQLTVPGRYELEAFLLNQNGPAIARPRLQIGLIADGKVLALSETEFAPLAAGENAFRLVAIDVPVNAAAGSAELCLTLFDGNREIGRNGYDVTLQPTATALRPARNPQPTALLAGNAELETLMKQLQIPFARVDNMSELTKYNRAILPLSQEWKGAFASDLRNWVRAGGFLLLLEPECTGLPGFQEYKVVEAPVPLIEAIIPQHPVFDGLGGDDFDTWAENAGGSVVFVVLAPLNSAALAAKGATFFDKNLGAAAIEAVNDRGRVFISTFRALPVWRKNGAAARYLGNLLRYFATAERLYDARTLERPPFLRAAYPTPTAPEFIDLAPFANRDFADDKANDGRGGWTDQGTNDFRMIPKGRQTVAGIPFEIIDPIRNGGKGCLMLQGEEQRDFPAAITGIPAKGKFATLYFLHTAAWVPFEAKCGHYRIRYADGGIADCPLKAGVNINDWWDSDTLLPEALPVFVAANGAGGKVAFFVTRWHNPRPEAAIEAIDFHCTPGGNGPVPVLAAVTAEPASDKAATLYGGDDAAPRWGTGAEPEGPKATATLVTALHPVGGRSTRLTFPANIGNHVPFAILHFKPELLKRGPFRTLSFLVKSETGGLIDVVIPEAEWRSTRSASIDIPDTEAGWIRVRLDFAADFRLTGEEFDVGGQRPELVFYNGKDRESGYPRRAAEFEIADIRFE